MNNIQIETQMYKKIHWVYILPIANCAKLHYAFYSFKKK